MPVAQTCSEQRCARNKPSSLAIDL